MDQRNDAKRRLWIPSRDSLGNEVDNTLIEAAHKIWDRARLVVIRYLADDSDAADILEGAVDSASRLMENHHSIQCPEAYLFRSVVRESIRRRRRNQRISYVDSASLDRIAPPVSMDLDRALDEAKLIELLRACMDERCRTMYDLRVMDYDWRSIAKLIGYSDAHTAEVQFGKRFDRALKRLRANHERSMQKSLGREADE
jgi:DNA-directed RNA polymerase specialized sigma24 family protein